MADLNEKQSVFGKTMNIDETADIIREVVNIGIGEAANSLSGLVNTRVVIRVPEVLIMDIGHVREYIQTGGHDAGVYISQGFTGHIKGKSLLFYSRDCAIALLNLVSIDSIKTASLSESGIATLNEIGNIIMASCMSEITNLLGKEIQFEIPETSVTPSELYFGDMLSDFDRLEKAIILKNEMTIAEKNIQGHLFILLTFRDFNLVIDILKDKIL